MSIQSGCCCSNSESFGIGAVTNNNRRAPRYSGIIRPLAFLVITSLLGADICSSHEFENKDPGFHNAHKASQDCIRRRTISPVAMTVSHVCDKFSANSSFRVIKSDLTNLRSHLGTLSNEVKHVIKMRDKLENQLEEISAIILKISQAIHQFDIGDIRVNPHNIENVKQVVKNELLTYDGDKTGRTDYALEASGGSIITIRNTKPYVSSATSLLTVFGISLGHTQNTPRSIIQTSVLPGQCWAFQGSSGCVVIKLLGKVYVSSISVEHITKDMSPTGETSSAPQDFSVWGLHHADDPDGFLFGEFTYDNRGAPMQDFLVQNVSKQPYDIIEVKFHTNSGNIEYTCVYRIRVHGSLDRDEAIM